MSYRFDASDPSRPTFRRTFGGSIAAVGCFGILSLLGLAAGVGALYLGDVALRVTVVALGIGGLFGASLVLYATRVRLPREIIFDTTRGGMLVREGRRTLVAPDAVLPFSDFAQLRMRRVVSQSKNSKSVRYQIEACKKDGAIFTLSSSGNEQRARSILERLTASVDLTQSYDGPAPSPQETRLRVKPSPAGTEISWPSRVNLSRFFATLLLLGSIAAVSVPIAGHLHVVAEIVVGVLVGLIGVLVLFAQLRTWGARYTVELDDQQLRYGWRGGILASGEKSTPIAEIATVSFNFSPSDAQGGMMLLTPAQADAIRAASVREEHSPGEVLGLVMQLARAPSLATADLSFGDKITLERELQEALAKRGVAAE